MKQGDGKGRGVFPKASDFIKLFASTPFYASFLDKDLYLLLNTINLGNTKTISAQNHSLFNK
jgi:hypothetical protein